MINRLFFGLTGVLSLLMICPVSAESAADSIVLNISTSINMALNQNRTIQLKALETESDKVAYDNRMGSLIPTIKASTGVEYSNIAVSGLTDPDSTYGEDPLGFNAALSFSLSLDRKLKYDMEETRIDYEAGRIGYNTAQKQLVLDVEKKFYYLLTLRSEIEILEKNQELAEKRYGQTQRNYENGFATDLAVLQARVTASSYQPALSKARSDLDMETRNFLILLGLDPATRVKLNGDLSRPEFHPDRKELLESYPSGRQDIQEQMIDIESLKNDYNITRTSAFSPSLAISGSWSTSVDSPFEGSNWESDNWSDSGKIGLTLSVPLDPYIRGSEDQTDISQDLLDIKEAEITLALLMDTARVEIMNLTQQISTALEILKQSSLNRALAKKSYELSEASYNLGAVERLDVEDAQQAYLSAGQEYLDSQYQYLSGLIELRYALNLNSMEELYKLNRNEGTDSEK